MQAVLIFLLYQLTRRTLPQLLWQRKKILEGQTLAMTYLGLEMTPAISAHSPLARTNYVVPPRRKTSLYLEGEGNNMGEQRRLCHTSL